MPFSLGMLLELLFGELGPEPGALLHAESGAHKYILTKYQNKTKIKLSELRTVCMSLTCHVKGAFLGGCDGAVSTAQQRTAPPLAHLLLQPRAQL